MNASTNQYVIEAQAREKTGSAAGRRMRNQGILPAIVYGGKTGSQKIAVQHKQMLRLAEDHTILTQILQLKTGANSEDVLIKAIARHPYKKKILHMDFMRIEANKEMVVQAQLKFIGEDIAPGVKTEGGVISRLQTEVEIKCLPKDLPSEIEIDVSTLGLNQTLHFSDIKLPQGVELATELSDEHNPAILNIHPPAVVKEEETGAPEAAPIAGPATADKEEEEGKKEEK